MAVCVILFHVVLVLIRKKKILISFPRFYFISVKYICFVNKSFIFVQTRVSKGNASVAFLRAFVCHYKLLCRSKLV